MYARQRQYDLGVLRKMTIDGHVPTNLSQTNDTKTVRVSRARVSVVVRPSMVNNHGAANGWLGLGALAEAPEEAEGRISEQDKERATRSDAWRDVMGLPPTSL
eukprot:CAMPEP_0174750248 /NCGR_PEP_ID=MMETSP1094-20130205/97345_1 /TAXON_ID=156173 /ORGANISM="Chrysochromulina brevifilum, Strain UTEX LB 985" /LENGTH=102 /DNA_ID=CAMNT_0015955569 /DNA_START=35 /DNA_END=340 /DNA_ORIENTATION=+